MKLYDKIIRRVCDHTVRIPLDGIIITTVEHRIDGEKRFRQAEATMYTAAGCDTVYNKL